MLLIKSNNKIIKTSFVYEQIDNDYIADNVLFKKSAGFEFEEATEIEYETILKETKQPLTQSQIEDTLVYLLGV